MPPIRCCPLCPRESSASGTTRHRKTCETYQQFMDAGLRLAQQATRSALQARRQAVEVEEAGTEWIETNVTVSFALLILTQMVLTSRSPLALVKQTLAHLTRSHCHPLPLFLSPSLRHNPLCPNRAVLNAPTKFLLDIGICYQNRHHLPLQQLARPCLSSHVSLSLYETPFGPLRTVSVFGRNTCIDPLMIPMRSSLLKIYIALISPPLSLMMRRCIPSPSIQPTIVARPSNYFWTGKTLEVQQNEAVSRPYSFTVRNCGTSP